MTDPRSRAGVFDRSGRMSIEADTANSNTHYRQNTIDLAPFWSGR